MKKIASFIAFCLIVTLAVGQSYKEGVVSTANNVIIGPGTHYYEIDLIHNGTNNARIDWHWGIQMDYTSHTDTTKHSYARVQQMNGTKWTDYATPIAADSLKHLTANSAPFEDPFGFCGRRLRLKVFMGTTDTLKGVYINYTLIK